MRELSLFSGAGGGLLGTKMLGWNCVGYVEFNEYCQQILAQRIKDGILDRAPIFTDVREFIQSGAVDQYRGYIDVLTAGFPCQPFSVAGEQRGGGDNRNMWPETIEAIRRTRPRHAFLENVPGLLVHEYGRRIFADLAQAGFDARWTVLGADDVGAPHRRKRLWIMADSTNAGLQGHIEQSAQQTGAFARQGEAEDVADSDEKRSQGVRPDDGQKRWEIEGGSPGLRDGAELGRKPDWWATEPNVGRVAHGVANRVDRLKALGNGQVPAVAATAWRILA
jgi:DNA (cytosine-5)-methyltransferase 1